MCSSYSHDNFKGLMLSPLRKARFMFRKSCVFYQPCATNILWMEALLGCQNRFLPILKKQKRTSGQEFDTAYAESGFSGQLCGWNEHDGLCLPAEDAVSPGGTNFDCLNTWTQCRQVREELWKGLYPHLRWI